MDWDWESVRLSTMWSALLITNATCFGASLVQQLTPLSLFGWVCGMVAWMLISESRSVAVVVGTTSLDEDGDVHDHIDVFAQEPAPREVDMVIRNDDWLEESS